ncbi:phosphatase 2C-like domain-containing protein [Crepidotus variabilis]|uniref:Phosphatase 2C-like domain-containing protein n=1 Tax=Crepidotus variabilis TaxID=179855 RepID=A0A9P6JQ52_9AGAR|nr:phosphatase 2C-like domain-containing protein [Crepidotus variabilis]
MLRWRQGLLRLLPICRLDGVRPSRPFHTSLASKSKNAAVVLAGAAIAVASYSFLPVTYNDAVERNTKKQSRTPKTTPFDEALKIHNIEYHDASKYGIAEIYGTSLPSNMPCEDRSATEMISFSSTLGFFMFGVFDGHNGAKTAEKLSKELLPYLTLHLADQYAKAASDSPQSGRNLAEPPDPVVSRKSLHATLKAAFVEFDNIMVHESAQRALNLTEMEYQTLNQTKEAPSDFTPSKETPKPTRGEAFKMLAEAYAGSCAVVGIYNSFQRSLHVALTGDCRAVLGRRILAPKTEQTGKDNGSEATTQTHSDPLSNQHVYEVHELSFDHSPKNQAEAEYQKTLHPDEPELLKNNRFLGWGPSRAFGDGVMKWSLAVQKRLWKECLGDRPRSEEVYKTPPYFTAEPDITTFEDVKKGDFVVVASDGLWDCLTNEEVVGLVGKWLEGRNSSQSAGRSSSAGQSSDKSDQEMVKVNSKSITFKPSKLPVVYPEKYDDSTQMHRYWRVSKRFILAPQDRDNVAHHLIRNALGGADTDLTETLHWMEGSRRRRFKDDITIQVIFFD